MEKVNTLFRLQFEEAGLLQKMTTSPAVYYCTTSYACASNTIVRLPRLLNNRYEKKKRKFS